MSLTFANLAGFWALLGIPVILAIHFLQRQSRLVTISTLFLLEQLKRESVSGQKFERLRNSIPLWLQILGVLLLTWLLIEPRWVKPESIQRIAIVLDGSASMSAFRENLNRELEEKLVNLGSKAKTTEYVVLDSRPESDPIHNGTEIPALLVALNDWEPLGSDHDPGPALRIGRSLVEADGLVIFVTDHDPVELPYNARVLAVGEVKPNVGFAGIDIEPDDTGEMTWRAIVRNYAESEQSREWIMQSGNQRTEKRVIKLAAGETRSLQGKFPAGADRIVLRLETDAFELDNELPAVLPSPKPFAIAKVSSPQLDEAFKEILGSFKNVVKPDENTPPDMALTSYDPLSPTAFPPRAVIALDQKNVPRNFLQGRIAAENHPYVSGLNWQGLIARLSPGIAVDEADTVLVWQGERPLIFYRTKGGNRQLFLNFDFSTSNANRLPAFIVMMHRFVEDLRNEKVAGKAENYEISQFVPVSFDAASEEIEDFLRISEEQTGPEPKPPVNSRVDLSRASSLQSPERPSFFTISQGENQLILGAAHFADTREADFTKAVTKSEIDALEGELMEQHTEADSRWQLWLILFLLLVALSWYFINRPTASAEGVGATA